MHHIFGQYFLNHHLREDELRQHIRAFKEGGYEGIFAHARVGMLTPYFSETWWHAIDVIVEECRANNLKLGIWDEDNYPSPVAGNRVTWNHPELTAQTLKFTVFEAKAGETVDRHFEEQAALLKCFALPRSSTDLIDITSHSGSVNSGWGFRELRHGAYSRSVKIGGPHWRAGRKVRGYGLYWTPETDCTIIAVHIIRTKEGHTTDILNPEAIRTFIQYTHEEYLKRYGQEVFDEVFTSTFMDEPAPSNDFPWTGRFEAEFTADHGYEISAMLPHLVLDIDKRTPLIRHHYRQTQVRLQCKNFLTQIQEWDAAHHLQSIGHLTRTEWLSLDAKRWPNELRCCKYLDLPCTDPLGTHVAWRDTASYHTGLKVVSSAAHLFDKPQAGSDALAVIGNEVSLRDLKFHLDYQMVLGITYFNVHGLCYSLDGPRKDEAPPSLFYQHTEWHLMRHLWDYTRNLCGILSQGKHLCQLAMLYPSTGLSCRYQPEDNPRETIIHLLIDDLLSQQKDFDFIDEITLAEKINADLSGFVAKYPCFLIAECEYIENGTAAILERYRQAGGKLYLSGDRPQLLGDTLDRPLAAWNLEIAPLDISSLPGPKLTGCGSQDVFIQQREIDGKQISFLFNRAEREFTGEFDGVPVKLEARGSLLLTPDTMPVSEPETVLVERLDNWEVTFGANQIPLSFWTMKSDTGAFRDFNMLAREAAPELPGGQFTFECRFLYSSEVRPVKLVLEESTFAGPYKCLVNDREITGFKPEQVYDCRNITADITAALRSGTTPTLNVVKFIALNPDGALLEMPYLYGEFQAEFRHGHKSLPYLTAAPSTFAVDSLADWSVWGYGGYSGSAEYHCQIDIAKTGRYLLDLGRVEDAAVIELDNRVIAVRPWLPYRTELGNLSAGKHDLKIRIANGPGNRDRLSGLPAGLLGPVKLIGTE